MKTSSTTFERTNRNESNLYCEYFDDYVVLSDVMGDEFLRVYRGDLNRIIRVLNKNKKDERNKNKN